MTWSSLLPDVMAVLKDGRSPAELAAHEASLRQLLDNMAATGHQRDVPVRTSLALAGDRWTTLIMEVLAAGALRHSEIKRVIDLISAEQEISQRVLTLKLRLLERDGFLLRQVGSGNTPRVDYRLTARGRDWHARVEALVRWAGEHTEGILASRHSYDAQHGAPTD